MHAIDVDVKLRRDIEVGELPYADISSGGYGEAKRITHHAGGRDIEGHGIIGRKVCDVELLYEDLLRV